MMAVRDKRNGGGASRVAAAAVLMLAGGELLAHESRPVYVELTEIEAGYFLLQWKVPASVPQFYLPAIVLPDNCATQGPIAEVSRQDGTVRRLRARCAGSLSGRLLRIEFPGPNPSVSSLVRYRSAKGETHTALLGPSESTWTVPAEETKSGVMRQYTILGIGHILGGADHLLFLLCLLWIAHTWKRMLITVTGFTLAHSTTLALSALDLVRLPIPPVEASIALSVVFLAREIARERRSTLTWRYPILVSGSFGLLHGFGFAAALQDVGLPQKEVLTGLLFFNVGVEIGQLLFAALAIVLALVVGKFLTMLMKDHFMTAMRKGSSYLIGSVAIWWMLGRLATFAPR